MALKATEEVKTHQPGLSVRVQADCPKEFLDAVCHLVAQGTGFPAIHSDARGYQMLLNAGYEPDDARDWNNCGCVVPHFRKTGEWTAAVNMNFGSAMEYALNQGYSLMTGEKMGLETRIGSRLSLGIGFNKNRLRRKNYEAAICFNWIYVSNCAFGRHFCRL